MDEIKRKFNLNDQSSFAEISGDYNPVHLDNLIARRSIFGEIIVHGMHLVLWAINEQLIENNYKYLSRIKVNFLKGVILGNEVKYKWQNKEKNTFGNIFVNENLAVKIELYWSQFYKKDLIPINSLPPKELSIEVDMNFFSNKVEHLDLFFPKEKIINLFPNLIKKLNPTQISTLLASTRLIGNKCPGLNSIFTKIDINFEKSFPIENFEYQLRRYDERFGLAKLLFKSPNSEGFITAFERPKPVIQKSYKIVQSLIRNDEFNKIKALVIGGSRGLGEVATKILCAGGANVTATYYSGKKESEIISREINSSSGELNFKFFDVTKKGLPFCSNKYDLVIYMATPFITTSESEEFNQKLFKNFCEYYLFGFSNLCDLLSLESETKVLYPSSIYVDQVPFNLVEYCAAKAAGENLCISLEKHKKNLKVFSPRFNRLETDQTSSLLPQNLDDSILILLNAIRETLKKK